MASFLALPLLAFAPLASAADTTVIIKGNTSPGENQQGWFFARDLNNDTPYNFTTDEKSIGQGSLYVQPIGSSGPDKFIAENFIKAPIADVESLSYDYKIAGNGTAADATDFYINVYANIDNSDQYYDCRYGYVENEGSTKGFSNAKVNIDEIPTVVSKYKTSRLNTDCPATLDQMPQGSYIRAYSINVGQTNNSDQGLAAYLDNATVTTNVGTITYDFEPTIKLTSKDQCKNGDWATSNTPVYKNQGDCVSSFASQGKAKGNPVVNFVRNLF